MTDTTRKLLDQFRATACGQEVALLPQASPEERLALFFSLYRGDPYRLYDLLLEAYEYYPHSN